MTAMWPKLCPEVIKLFSCSSQLSTKFIPLINVKMLTIVGILTFISMINTTPERLKARNFFICRYFIFYEQLKFHAQLSWAWKSFITYGPDCFIRRSLSLLGPAYRYPSATCGKPCRKPLHCLQLVWDQWSIENVWTWNKKYSNV